VNWNHQIVATRRVKAVQQIMEYDPEDDEQAPDIETMTVGSATDVKKAEPKTSSQDEAKAKPKAKEESKPAADKATNKKNN
jgi:hypothetical protein